MSNMENTTSEQLMQAIAQGDLDAFNAIVLRHQEMVWGIAYRFLGDRHVAEDIAQEAFLRILDAAPRYKPSAEFRTYLSRVVTRLCLDYSEKRRPVYAERLPEAADATPAGAEQAAAKDEENAIRQALDSLPPNQRMAVVLRYWEGLNCRDIAAAMETSGKAVERLLAHAREALQPKLARLIEE
jgi:RNA polymerase sigma-70 factor (ECF subfamily)